MGKTHNEGPLQNLLKRLSEAAALAPLEKQGFFAAKSLRNTRDALPSDSVKMSLSAGKTTREHADQGHLDEDIQHAARNGSPPASSNAR